MPTPSLFPTLNLFLAFVVVVATTSSVYGEPNGGNSEYLLPQRLVRRGFLRFGKRSHLENSLPAEVNEAIADQENTKGVYLYTTLVTLIDVWSRINVLGGHIHKKLIIVWSKIIMLGGNYSIFVLPNYLAIKTIIKIKGQT